jgi:hypothetical protein
VVSRGESDNELLKEPIEMHYAELVTGEYHSHLDLKGEEREVPRTQRG